MGTDDMRPTMLLLMALGAWWAVAVAAAHTRLIDVNDPLGSPGELAWQAWLLMDATASAARQSQGAAARRITPKSVFIAPAFAPHALPACAEGSRRDPAGRCVQLVHVNRETQLSFLLQRLNALHARPSPPMRFPLPAGDSGPFKVPLQVPPAATTTPAPTPAPTHAPMPALTPAPTPSPTTAPTTAPTPALTPLEAPSKVSAEEGNGIIQLRVSVITADVSKRHSAEGDLEDNAEDDNERPLISVWSIDNDTLDKSQGAESPFVVEIPLATKLQTTSVTADVIAPAAAESALPILVISPATVNSTASSPTPTQGTHKDDEGSGAAPAAATVTLGQITSLDDEMASGTEQPGTSGAGVVEQTGLSHVVEHIQVIPIPENSRHDVPFLIDEKDSLVERKLVGKTHFDALDATSGAKPLRHSIIGDSKKFPSSLTDEPHTVHLFKGNYVKEQTHLNNHNPGAEENVKESLRWLPSEWRVQQRREVPALEQLWSQMRLSEDFSTLNRYNPSPFTPLPYQQRQTQYDPQWPALDRQMAS